MTLGVESLPLLSMSAPTRIRKANGTTAAAPPSGDSDATPDPQINERLATDIQRELWFRTFQLPSKITRTIGMVPLSRESYSFLSLNRLNHLTQCSLCGSYLYTQTITVRLDIGKLSYCAPPTIGSGSQTRALLVHSASILPDLINTACGEALS
ncbi:hypothetical protein B0H11DRAFT_431176 [Mycena galericulata]|nr:hypothetical protein B0H11DRAFT_431176 [Mycena galericulata]